MGVCACSRRSSNHSPVADEEAYQGTCRKSRHLGLRALLPPVPHCPGNLLPRPPRLPAAAGTNYLPASRCRPHRPLRPPPARLRPH